MTEVLGPPAEPGLTEEERAIQATAHRYAREIMPVSYTHLTLPTNREV